MSATRATGRDRQDPGHRRGGRRPLHSLLSNTDPKAEGPYPTMVDNPDGYKVPVVQAASYSKYLGEFKVVFDDNGVVKEASGDPIYLDKSITPDRRRARPHQGTRRADRGAEEQGSGRDHRRRSTAAARAAAPRNARWATSSPTPSSTASRDRASRSSFQNGGGLRASIDKGTVTMGEVLTVLPFQNTLATFQISGKDMVAALEDGLSQIEDGDGTLPAGRGPEILLRQVGRAQCRPRQVGRGDGERRLDADRSGQGLSGRHQQLRRARAATATRSSPKRPRTPMTTARASNRWSPTISARTGPTRRSSTAASPRSPRRSRRLRQRSRQAGRSRASRPRSGTSTPAPAAEPAKPAEAAPARRDRQCPHCRPTRAISPTRRRPYRRRPRRPPPAARRTGQTSRACTSAPPAPAPAAGKPAKPAEASHVIVAGDTYWDLAKKAYGDATKWKLISDANKGHKPHRLAARRDADHPGRSRRRFALFNDKARPGNRAGFAFRQAKVRPDAALKTGAPSLGSRLSGEP